MSGLQIAFAVTGISPAHQVLKCIPKQYYTFGYKSIKDLNPRYIFIRNVKWEVAQAICNLLQQCA
jgi:hypothetical protein